MEKRGVPKSERDKVVHEVAALLQIGPLLKRRPGPEVRSAAEILTYAKRHGKADYHPVGTCKMGADAMAVVDPSSSCAASSACACATPRSCRVWSAATPTPRP